MARFISLLLVLPICKALLDNIERPSERSPGSDQEQPPEYNTFGQIDLPLNDANLHQIGWTHETPDTLMYSQYGSLQHEQDTSSLFHPGVDYSGYREHLGSIFQQPSSSQFGQPLDQQPGCHSLFDTGTSHQGGYLNHDYGYSRHPQYASYPPYGSSSAAATYLPSIKQEHSLLLASAYTSSRSMLNPLSDQGQSEIMSRYYTSTNNGGENFRRPPQGREERGEREQVQEPRAAGGINSPTNARDLAEAAEPVPARAPSMTTRERDESRDLVCAILGVEWTRRRLSHDTHPQDLAAQVAEIKLTHPGHDRSIGQLAKLYVQSWNDYDYLYDYKAWVECYTIKINSLRCFYNSEQQKDDNYHHPHQRHHEWTTEQVNWAILNEFRHIQISHHGSLADPTQEAQELLMAQRVWSDFVHRQVGQDTITKQQASDMPSMAHYCSGYRYGSSTYAETMKYIKKYLRHFFGVTVPKIEELTELLPESVIAASRPALRRRRH